MRITEHLWLRENGNEKYGIGDTWYKVTHANILEDKVVHADFYRCVYYYIRRIYTLTGKVDLLSAYNFVCKKILVGLRPPDKLKTLEEVETILAVPIAQITKLKKVTWFDKK